MQEDLEIHDKVQLADGSEIPVEYLATIPNGHCFISPVGVSIAEAMAAFTDPEKTKTITYGEHVLTGYTVFVAIMQEEPGHYKIALRRRFEGE